MSRRLADIEIGYSYTVTQAPADPGCTNSRCPIHYELVPWFALYGRRVTILETGLDCYGHPAVKVGVGKVDWHAPVVVQLTDDQVKQLGLMPSAEPVTYAVVGRVWAGHPEDMTGPGDSTDEDATFYMGQKVETPRQRTTVLPVCCLNIDSRRKTAR